MEITIDNFSPHNRDKRIGNSLYRICREQDDSGKWYVLESCSDGVEWSRRRSFFSDNLQYVIEKINGFNKEKEITNRMLAREFPENRTNADRIRAMSDEELAEFIDSTRSRCCVE